MYLLALDESGTHSESPVLIVAGVAVHEADVRRLETKLHAVLGKHLHPLRLNPDLYELHATDLKTPSAGKPARGIYPATSPSRWGSIKSSVRLDIIADAYEVLAGFEANDPRFPLRIIGAVIEHSHVKYRNPAAAEDYAYDHVLHRFDDMLHRLRSAHPAQHGLILHDRREDRERKIQTLASGWQRSGARLDSIVQVPVFSDSKSSRLLQAADFVAYALWRHYHRTPGDDSYSKQLWSLVDVKFNNEMSGLIHITPDFGRCLCPPCISRRSQPKHAAPQTHPRT